MERFPSLPHFLSFTTIIIIVTCGFGVRQENVAPFTSLHCWIILLVTYKQYCPVSLISLSLSYRYNSFLWLTSMIFHRKQTLRSFRDNYFRAVLLAFLLLKLTCLLVHPYFFTTYYIHTHRLHVHNTDPSSRVAQKESTWLSAGIEEKTRARESHKW